MEKERQIVTGKAEKIFYGLGDMGANFIWTFVSSFLTLYYTDSAMLSVAFVGTMMLVARIFDGVSDIVMGVVIEKTHTRWGKARPWVMFSTLPLVISFLLMFRVPQSWNAQSKNIYVFITYFLMTVVFYTMNNLSYHAMLSRISLTQEDRNTVSTVRTFISWGGILLLSVLTPVLLAAFGGETNQGAWEKITWIYAIVAFVLLVCTFLFTKEKIDINEEKEKKEKNQISTGAALKELLHTKYFYVALILFVLCYVKTTLTTGGAVYYAKDVLGDSGLYSLIAICLIIPVMVGSLFMPAMMKRFGKRNMILASSVVAIIGSVVGYIDPGSLQVTLISQVLKSVGSVPASVALFTLAPDIVEYVEKKIGVRVEGLTTSVNSFGMKVGTGFGSALLGWLLAFGGYDATLSAQTASTISIEVLIFHGIPLILTILMMVDFWFWDIDKKKGDIAE